MPCPLPPPQCPGQWALGGRPATTAVSGAGTRPPWQPPRTRPRRHSLTAELGTMGDSVSLGDTRARSWLGTFGAEQSRGLQALSKFWDESFKKGPFNR